MAFGVKTNERPGTRAQLSHARFSAYKAREVLNLIRGKSVAEAIAILQFTERGAAEPILKLLMSAIANAEHNDGIGRDELFVSACFADEGPTLKRFRPRARGRAGRIRKRTCHITIIVSRMSGEQLERHNQVVARRGSSASPAASRARRVAQSRKAEAPAEDVAEVEAPADEVAEDAATDSEASEDTVVDEVGAETAEQNEDNAADADEKGDN
jgi:large subunit ribosomal protein L22